jgi:hypothetical protein
MDPWMIERIEDERRRQEQQDRRIPLRIHEPPPEWVEEQQRRQEAEQREPSNRGVWIIDL